MSQHYFCAVHKDKLLNVLIGWDRPLQGFFLVVNHLNSTADKSLWCNLDHEPAHPKTLDLFLGVLKNRFTVVLPAPMIEELLKDSKENMGNKTIYHAVLDGIYQRTVIAGDSRKQKVMLPTGAQSTVSELLT